MYVSSHNLPFICIISAKAKRLSCQAEKAHRSQTKNPGNFAGILAFVQLKEKRRTAFLQIPFPSLAGQMAIVNQAVLLAPVHRLPAPSQGMRPSDIPCRVAHCYSGGTAPAYTGFPIKSYDT